MALVICPECGKEVSNKANACVHCGYPLSDMAKVEPITIETEKANIQDDEIELLISEAERLRTAKEYGESFIVYERAAKLGASHAQVWVANYYRRGLGREKDYAKALSWFEKAAQQKNCDALNNIGMMYYNGEGVQQNYDTAIDYFEQAINLGSIEAKNNLGILYNNLAVCYIDGKNVDADYGRANNLLNKALELGNEKAKENFAVLQNLIQQKKLNELTVKTIWVAIGMWICIIVGFVLFVMCIMDEQYQTGVFCIALFAALGLGIYYCGPKIVRENMEAREKRAQYAKLHEGVRCPNCGMNAGHRISDFSKKASIGFWGIASSKLGKTYECENCKYMW